jgi:hypothetical protein
VSSLVPYPGRLYACVSLARCCPLCTMYRPLGALTSALVKYCRPSLALYLGHSCCDIDPHAVCRPRASSCDNERSRVVSLSYRIVPPLMRVVIAHAQSVHKCGCVILNIIGLRCMVSYTVLSALMHCHPYAGVTLVNIALMQVIGLACVDSPHALIIFS